MTLEPERMKELDDALLESLLRDSFMTEEARANDVKRIDFALSRIEDHTTPSGSHRWSQFTWQRFVSIALAASVLIAAGFLFSYMSSPSTAYAAVMRSLESQPSTRLYRIRMVHQRPIWGKREVAADLYLNDQDNFVVRHPGWGGFGDIWIGGDAHSRWIAPRVGPAFTGGEEIVGGWLSKKDIPSPYLHVSTVLERMSRVYRLEMLDNECVTHAGAPEKVSDCQHVVGTLRSGNRTLPTQIELWADADTGIARRLELTWEREPSDRGPISWTIELMGLPELPRNWFELEGHIDSNRKVIPLQSTAVLDAAENETN